MLRDRYGRVPPEAENLVEQFVLGASLHALGIRRLSWREETYLIEYADRVALEQALGGREVELRPLRAGQAHLVVPPERRSAAAAVAWIHELLLPAAGPTKMTAGGNRP